MILEPVLDAQQPRDVEFNYKGIKIIAARQVVAIVSKIIINHEILPPGVKLKLSWE